MPILTFLVSGRFIEPRILLASTLALTLLALMHPAWAWNNGGYSADPNETSPGSRHASQRDTLISSSSSFLSVSRVFLM